MKKGLSEKLKLMLLAVGILLIIGSFFFPDYTTGDRMLCCCIGILLCLLATVNALRWAAASLFFVGLALANIPLLINDDGSFDFTALILLALFLIPGIHFGEKAINQFRHSRITNIDMLQIDNMTGLEFEEFTASLLKSLGYVNVKTTKASGDQGIDVLASNGGIKYAIQCKHYSGKLDNTAVQEAFAGKAHYGCDIAAVITNSTFTTGAKELAQSTGVLLWDRCVLQEMLSRTHTCAVPTKNTENHCRTKATPSTAVSAAPTVTNTPATKQTNTSKKESIPTERYLENFSKGIQDDMLPAAVEAILSCNQARISTLQRRLRVGYARACLLMNEMEEKEIVGPLIGSSERPILITPTQWDYIQEQLSSNAIVQITDEQWDTMRNWYDNSNIPDEKRKTARVRQHPSGKHRTPSHQT